MILNSRQSSSKFKDVLEQFEHRNGFETLNLHHFRFWALKTDVNFILLGFKSHWLHDAAVIWRLACEWLSREVEEDSSLAIVGFRTGMSIKWAVNHMSCQSKGVSFRRSVVEGWWRLLWTEISPFLLNTFCSTLCLHYPWCNSRGQFIQLHTAPSSSPQSHCCLAGWTDM